MFNVVGLRCFWGYCRISESRCRGTRLECTLPVVALAGYEVLIYHLPHYPSLAPNPENHLSEAFLALLPGSGLQIFKHSSFSLVWQP